MKPCALTQDDLQPLSQSYPPPTSPAGPDDQSQPVPLTTEDADPAVCLSVSGAGADPPGAQTPAYLSVLKARPGASTIPLGEASPHLLAVEHRVGRGRITMLTINPNEEALLAWPGLDTLVRRVVLRRPEEPRSPRRVRTATRPAPEERGRLLATDLSWYRIMSRDAGPGPSSPPSAASRGESAARTGDARPVPGDDPDAARESS